MSDSSLPPDLAAFEARLAALAPQPPALARDELMYRAGWAAAEAALTSTAAEKSQLVADPTSVAEGRSWLWPSATAILALLLATLTIVHVVRPPQIVHMPAPSALPVVAVAEPIGPAEKPARSEYLELREMLLRKGLEGLRDTTPTSASEDAADDPDYRQMRHDLLGT